MYLEDARIGEAAHQRLANLGRVGTGLGGQQQRLAHRLDGQRDDDLVGHLGDLAVAVAADQGDVLAHQLEQWPDLVEGGLAAADHDGEAGGLGADLATRHRRVEVLAAERVDALGEALGGDRRDRAHVDHDLALGEPAATPFSLNSASSTWGVSGTMVITMSAWRATSAPLAHVLAPAPVTLAGVSPRV